MFGLDFLQGNSGEANEDTSAGGFLGKAMSLVKENTKKAAKQFLMQALKPVIMAVLPFVLQLAVVVIIIILVNEALRDPLKFIEDMF
ncbi:MAG: hypothetical protein UY09_C0012G0006 [Parcubacteria group bacterium GW2011_GWA2_47_8]|nr:MAG: hypothetical protein UY09_C0012G0006 [Parcubacteria group bacterium GW2011_GWA2_47_8]OHB19909.1 MAG: hypothetical protein A2666_01095 [Parcubacteria group bacterium RIFCSPHIGHO2_01_FULL_47_10b]